ncbi:Mobile element protein [Caballeronia sordidicola]|uniref:Mobile element protein n=1 Tax=Caballeronia sordidicola TaxID=196367 RepID=A0A242NAD3_CABSO|nr:Mobile element protein [Caballeronia sordidicola]
MSPRSFQHFSQLWARAHNWEKGVVEKNVQDSRQRIWASAREERFASLAELNAWLDSRCRTLWGEVRHPDYKGVSVADVLDQEREHLMPMPAPFDGYVERLARVSSTCLVVIARNRYSVPCEFAGQMLSTRLYPTRIVVVAQNIVVAGHDRLAGEGQVQYDWQHYVTLLQRKPGALRNGAPFLDMPEPLKRLRVGLLREAGGDRVMAKVLALVPANGLDAVLAAVELALEQMPCSGRVSVEHVENVLARLRDAQLPPKIDTQLQLSTPPLANTSRYDGLRSTTSELDHA